LAEDLKSLESPREPSDEFVTMSTEWFQPWWVWQPEVAGVGDWA
jgi:hypothetical protein